MLPGIDCVPQNSDRSETDKYHASVVHGLWGDGDGGSYTVSNNHFGKEEN